MANGCIEKGVKYKGKKSKYTGWPYLLKYSNEINFLAYCMKNRIALRYTNSLINCHHKTQGLDAVCKSTVNIAFNILKRKIKNTENSTNCKE